MHNTPPVVSPCALHSLLSVLASTYNLPPSKKTPLLHVAITSPALFSSTTPPLVDKILHNTIPLIPPNPAFLAHNRFTIVHHGPATPSPQKTLLHSPPYLFHHEHVNHSLTEPLFRNRTPTNSADFAAAIHPILLHPFPIRLNLSYPKSDPLTLREQYFLLSHLLCSHFNLNPWQQLHSELSTLTSLLNTLPLDQLPLLKQGHIAGTSSLTISTPKKHYCGDTTPFLLQLHFPTTTRRKPLTIASLSPSYSSPHQWTLFPQIGPSLPLDSLLAIQILELLEQTSILSHSIITL